MVVKFDPNFHSCPKLVNNVSLKLKIKHKDLKDLVYTMKEREGRKKERGRGKKGREERERKGGREEDGQCVQEFGMNRGKAVRRKKRL